MSEAFTSKVDAAKRLAELRKEGAESADDAEEGIDFELEVETPAFSILSADRQRKVMVEFRMLDGDRKARTYAFLAGIDFNPSKGIVMDFSADAVKISGRNLAPLFDGLVAQRIASRSARMARFSTEPSLYLPAVTLPPAPLKWTWRGQETSRSQRLRARPGKSQLTPPLP